jgi:hypothetical protein
MSEQNRNPRFAGFEKHLPSADCWCKPIAEYVPPRLRHTPPIVWQTVKCPTCHAVAGLACEDADGYRQPRQTHPARVELFYDLTEQRGQ